MVFESLQECCREESSATKSRILRMCAPASQLKGLHTCRRALLIKLRSVDGGGIQQLVSGLRRERGWHSAHKVGAIILIGSYSYRQ
jgi:hypothetical protein